MSTTDTSAATVYQLDITGVSTSASAQFATEPDGWTDEFAIQVGQALAALPWPAGNSWSITRVDMNSTEVFYTLDLAAQPPAFD